MGQYWSKDNKDTFYGQHEVGEFEAEPEDLNNLQSRCRFDLSCTKEHNGHRDMILASKFTRDHIPEPYNQIENIYKLTKTLAFLTVRLMTKRVSSNRPEYIPGTTENFPLFDKKGTESRQVGSGRICDVVTLLGTVCTCRTCKFSQNPSPNCYIIKVFTATHVIYDDEEAKDATCTLFYDGSDKRENVTLYDFKKIWCDANDDLCLLKTVTCDAELSTKLFDKIKKFNNYWESLKYMREKDRTKEQLVIIVSHPHGCFKRISVGFGLDIGALQNTKYSKFIYNSPTCPGTSGAPVYILGYDWFGTEFVHSGRLTDSSDTTLFKMISSDQLLKIFPSYEMDSSVIPMAYSSRYINTETEENRANNTSNLSNTTTRNCLYANYSAKWNN